MAVELGCGILIPSSGLLSGLRWLNWGPQLLSQPELSTEYPAERATAHRGYTPLPWGDPYTQIPVVANPQGACGAGPGRGKVQVSRKEAKAIGSRGVGSSCMTLVRCEPRRAPGHSASAVLVIILGRKVSGPAEMPMSSCPWL